MKFTPGEFNIADYMSRNPIEGETENVADQYINFIESNVVPEAISIEQLKVETAKDPI